MRRVPPRTSTRGVKPRASARDNPAPPAGWTFFSNHAHVLFCLASNPELRLREIAARVGITERGAQRIVAELAEAGYLAIERKGRRNRYQVHGHLALRHPIEAHRTVGDLIGWLGKSAPPRSRARRS